MELEKGVCFSCDNKKLILNQCSERIQQIFVLLYTDTVLNVNLLLSIIPELKLCPVCHHKLIILEQIYKHIEANLNEKDVENCALCKKGDIIFKTSKSYLKDISDDFPVFSDKHKYDICSQCCFYLDCRYSLKKRLFSQYPQLRIVPKLKLKFGSDITSHSTPLVIEKRERFRRHKRSSSQVILTESDTEMPPQKTQFFLDLSSIQSFEVLRNNKLISKSKDICKDSKLLNQILYIKLSRKNLTSEKRNRSSKDIEAQEDLKELPKISKKNSMTREKSKKLDTILDSEKETLMEKNEYNSKNSASKADIETSESVPISEEDSHETLKVSLNMQKNNYFRIKMKKQTTRKNKSEIKHVEKNNTIPDNFKKALIVNLERKVLVGRTDQPIEKNLENDEDMSIEVIESEEKSQTVIDNSKMDIGSTDNSKFEEQCSVGSAEDKDSKKVNSKKIISGVCEELGSEDKIEKSNENDNEQESNGYSVSNSQCDKNKSEINEHENGNSNEEQPGEDENEKSSTETIDTEKNDNIADKEGLSQTSVDEEESSKEKSDDSLEVAALKTKAVIDQEKTDEETDDKQLQGNQEQTDEKSDEDEDNGKKETDNIYESGDEKETSHKEETDDDKEINNKNKSDNREGSSEKEIGIGEEDRSNIDMMLSGITAEPSKDAEEVEGGATDNSKDVSNADQDIDIVTGCKRKRSASPDVSNPEKKKKKVTFSEEVLESSE